MKSVQTGTMPQLRNLKFKVCSKLCINEPPTSPLHPLPSPKGVGAKLIFHFLQTHMQFNFSHR